MILKGLCAMSLAELEKCRATREEEQRFKYKWHRLHQGTDNKGNGNKGNGNKGNHKKMLPKKAMVAKAQNSSVS